MRDASQALRVKVWEVISNLVPAISIYDINAPDDAGFPRVIIETISKGASDNSKCGFGGDWTIQLKVTDAFKHGMDRTRIDVITDEIFQALVPFSTALMPQITGWSIWNADASVLAVLNYEDNVRKYVDKNIQITYSLTEN